jgi:hypothetical protein
MASKVTKTGELQQALEQEQGAPVYLVGLDGEATHVVVPIDDARHMFDDYLRRELQVGFDQADRGEFVDWDPERLKAEGRERLQRRSSRP